MKLQEVWSEKMNWVSRLVERRFVFWVHVRSHLPECNTC